VDSFEEVLVLDLTDCFYCEPDVKDAFFFVSFRNVEDTLGGGPVASVMSRATSLSIEACFYLTSHCSH